MFWQATRMVPHRVIIIYSASELKNMVNYPATLCLRKLCIKTMESTLFFLLQPFVLSKSYKLYISVILDQNKHT